MLGIDNANTGKEFLQACHLYCVCVLTLKSEPVPWPFLASLHDVSLFETNDTLSGIKLHGVEPEQLEPQQTKRLLTLTLPPQMKGRKIIKVVAVTFSRNCFWSHVIFHGTAILLVNQLWGGVE